MLTTGDTIIQIYIMHDNRQHALTHYIVQNILLICLLKLFTRAGDIGDGLLCRERWTN